MPLRVYLSVFLGRKNENGNVLRAVLKCLYGPASTHFAMSPIPAVEWDCAKARSSLLLIQGLPVE